MHIPSHAEQAGIFFKKKEKKAKVFIMEERRDSREREDSATLLRIVTAKLRGQI